MRAVRLPLWATFKNYIKNYFVSSRGWIFQTGRFYYGEKSPALLANACFFFTDLFSVFYTDLVSFFLDQGHLKYLHTVYARWEKSSVDKAPTSCSTGTISELRTGLIFINIGLSSLFQLQRSDCFFLLFSFFLFFVWNWNLCGFSWICAWTCGSRRRHPNSTLLYRLTGHERCFKLNFISSVRQESW